MNNKETLRKWLASRLDEAVSASGMKIEAICSMSGMPYSTLNSKRRGYSAVSFEDIYLLAPILHIQPSYFIPPQFDLHDEPIDSIKQVKA